MFGQLPSVEGSPPSSGSAVSGRRSPFRIRWTSAVPRRSQPSFAPSSISATAPIAQTSRKTSASLSSVPSSRTTDRITRCRRPRVAPRGSRFAIPRRGCCPTRRCVSARSLGDVARYVSRRGWRKRACTSTCGRGGRSFGAWASSHHRSLAVCRRPQHLYGDFRRTNSAQPPTSPRRTTPIRDGCLPMRITSRVPGEGLSAKAVVRTVAGRRQLAPRRECRTCGSAARCFPDVLQFALFTDAQATSGTGAIRTRRFGR